MVVSELNRLSYALSEDDSEEVIAAKLCDIVSSNIEKPDGTPLSQSELVDFVTVWLDAPPTKTRIDCWPKFLEILYGEPFVLESRFKKGAFGVSGSNKWAEGVFPASFDPKERDFIMSLWALDGQEVRFYKKPTETFEEAKLEGAYDPIGAFDTL